MEKIISFFAIILFLVVSAIGQEALVAVGDCHQRTVLLPVELFQNFRTAPYTNHVI